MLVKLHLKISLHVLLNMFEVSKVLDGSGQGRGWLEGASTPSTKKIYDIFTLKKFIFKFSFTFSTLRTQMVKVTTDVLIYIFYARATVGEFKRAYLFLAMH